MAFGALGIDPANAGPPQHTTTALTVTDASTGQAVSGSVSGTELVDLTITITGTSSAPTGSVSLWRDGTPLCPGSGGSCGSPHATGPTTSALVLPVYLPSGTYNLSAKFTGLPLYFPSASASDAFDVSTTILHNTTTLVGASPGTITTGSPTTLTATVTSNDGSGTPHGTVSFYTTQGGTKTSVGSGTLDASGQASISKSDWGPQAYQIEADYAGQVFDDDDGDTIKYATSSGATMLTVNPQADPRLATTTSVTVTPTPVRSDANVLIVATIAQTGDSALSLASTVHFTAQRNGTSGTVPLCGTPTTPACPTLVDNGNGTGTATLTKGSWVPGSYTVTAQYVQNIYFDASTGQTTALVVNQARPSTTTYVHDTQAYVGRTATLSATITDSTTGQPVPPGDLVSLTADDPSSTGCVTTTAVGGVASCTVTFQTSGTYSVDAQYNGDSIYDPSSTFGQIEVDRIPTAITYTGDTTTRMGLPATLSQHLVDSTTGLPLAGASVTLALNGNPSETCTATTDASGNVSCTVTVTDQPGSYDVAVSYGGNFQYLPSSANPPFVVTPPLPTHLTYSGDTSAIVGRPATISFTLTDDNGAVMPGRSVTLTLPDGSTTTVTTDSSGVASKQIVAPASAATYGVGASYGGEPGYLSSTGTGNLATHTLPTSLTYVGGTNVNGGTPATIAFELTDSNGNTLSNLPVTLTLPDGSTYATTTNASGIASETITAPVPGATRSYDVSASFGTQLPYTASDGTGSLTVDVTPTTLTYTGTTSVYGGQPATISFVLRDASGNTLPNVPVTLTMPDGSTYVTMTDASGVASHTVDAPTPSHNTTYSVAASFGGHLWYLASSGSGRIAVKTVPTTLTYVGDTSAYGGTPTDIAFELTDSSGYPVAGMPVTLTLPDGSTATVTTDSNGIASDTVDAPLTTGTYPVSASFGGKAQYLSSSGTGSVQVTAVPTTISYTGDSRVVYGNKATLAAKLLTNSGQALASEPVTLTLASGEHCSATTNASGIATCLTTTAVTAAAGAESVLVSFAGDPPYLPSSNTGTIGVVVPTTTTIAALQPVLTNSMLQLSATLVDASTGSPLAGRTLTLTLGTQSCIASPTNADGVASCAITGVTADLGPVSTRASYAGAQYYEPSSDTGSTLVYAYAPGGGSFVVGDESDTGDVYFWGSQWWKENTLSGYTGHGYNSFKGFALDVPNLACGANWSSDPGNSSPPPDGPLPAYMAVIVSSTVTKSGSTLSGHIAKMVIVQTDSGYESNPGHDGTGTVVATLCGGQQDDGLTQTVIVGNGVQEYVGGFGGFGAFDD